MTYVSRSDVYTLLIAGAVIITGMIGFAPGDESRGVSVIEQPSEVDLVSDSNQAKRQAEILHTSIHSTLQAVHDRYYREDEGLPIPAAVMADVFRELESKQKVTLRWLAVEGQAMNTDHQPRDPFESEAVEMLKSGKAFHDQTKEGLYRRAAPITLSNHCLKCHMPDRKSTRDRIAGLIIAIPVND